MDGYVTIGTKIETKDFERQIDHLTKYLEDLEDDYNRIANEKPFEGQAEQLKKMSTEIISTKKKIKSLKTEQDKLNQNNFSNIKKIIEETGNSTGKVIKKITKWGLAIFSVRSAYMGIRQAISLVSGQNDEVSDKLNQMRNVLANSLLPIVNTIINYIGKLMVYINYIFKQLTGRNLFDFSKAMSNASNDLSDGAKSASEIRKQLAGFDEMNILGDNVTSAGSIGKVDTQQFENMFDSLKNIKIPKWLQNLAKILKEIKKYWKEVIIVVGAFAAAILALKITNFITDLLKLEGVTTKVKAGIGLLTSGIVLLAGSIINMILNWDKLSTKEKIITTMLAVVGAAFIALGYAISTGISAATLGIGALIAAITALVTAAGTYIYKLITEKSAIDDVTQAEKNLEEQKAKTRDAYEKYIQSVDDAIEAHNNLIQIQNDTGLSGEELYKQVQNGTLTYKEMNNTQKEVYKAYLADIKAQEMEIETSKSYQKEVEKQKLRQWEMRLATDAQSESFKNGSKKANQFRDDVVDAWNKGEISTKTARRLISEAMVEMDKDGQRTFSQNLPDNIKKGLDPQKYQTSWQKFKSNWKSHVADLSTTVFLNFNIAATGINAIRKKIFGFAKGGIIVPRLASGGIINQPGRGVPLTSAIGGERGAEGVIPLTDSQQMALLGEAIGRYITINANITNTMNGRVISRELQKLNNESDFAFNR